MKVCVTAVIQYVIHATVHCEVIPTLLWSDVLRDVE